MEKISDVATERLETGVGALGPEIRDFANQKRMGETF